MIDKNLDIAGAAKAISETLDNGILALAIDITAQAKDICPVADFMGGNLKGSIQWVVDGGQSGGGETGSQLTERPPESGAIVGTPVEYGVYQEYGTRKMNAQPFLRPAVYIKGQGMNLREAFYRAFMATVPRELKKV